VFEVEDRRVVSSMEEEEEARYALFGAVVDTIWSS
jgi:hypothetical protein